MARIEAIRPPQIGLRAHDIESSHVSPVKNPERLEGSGADFGSHSKCHEMSCQ
jgi:hypothetical protein